MQRILNHDGVAVVCDYREREVAKQLEELGADVSMANLDAGDFLCSADTAVERKTHRDFVSSIIDGRLFDQAAAMKEKFKRPIIIVEGFSDRDVDSNSFHAAVASMMKNYSMSFMWTKNLRETARAIFWIAEKDQSDGAKKSRRVRNGKKPDGGKAMEYIVAGLPGVSAVLSRRLLEKFGSVENVMKAEEAELAKVKGVGKKLAKRIREVLSKDYPQR